MAKFSRRFNWLKNLFPPATALNIQPGDFGENIVPVHHVLNGTDRLREWLAFSGSGAAGITTVVSGAAPADKYWFVFACGAEHDDTGVSRRMSIGLDTPAGSFAAITTQIEGVPDLNQIGVPRAFIIPPRCLLRAKVNTLGGTKILTIRMIYLELDLGEPAPPSP